MTSTNNNATKSTFIKRIGLYGALAAVMLIILAACGTTESSNSTGTGQLAVPTVGATPTASGDMSMAEPTATAGSSGLAIEPAPTTAASAGSGSQAGGSAQASGGTQVQATLREWAIDMSTNEVPAGKITFVVTNEGRMAHNFTIVNDSGVVAATPNFRSSDGAQTLEVELQPGTYTIICSLPGHAQRGQKTDLTVK